MGYRSLQTREIEAGLIELAEPSRDRVLLEFAESFADFFKELPEDVQIRVLDGLNQFAEGDARKRLEFANSLALKILEELDQFEVHEEANGQVVEGTNSPTDNWQVSSRVRKIDFHGKPHGL